MPATAKKISFLDPSAVRENLARLPRHLWSQDTFRKSLRGLGATESILVQYDTEDPLNIEDGLLVRHPELYKLVGPAVDCLKNTTGVKNLRRLFFASLPPKSKIGMHIDPIEFSRLIRFHWALQTNSDCQMIFRRQRFHFAEGELWYFNNLVHHAAVNEGCTDRIHVIFDFEKEVL